MHPSFGIETIPTSTRWEDIIKEPPLKAFRAHLFKFVHYTTLTFRDESTPRVLDQGNPDLIVSETSVDTGRATHDLRLAA